MNHATQRVVDRRDGTGIRPLHAVLISTYDLGRQPFSLASPAAWLLSEGAVVETLDLAVEQLNADALRRANLIAFSVPMHTATRLTLHHLPAVKAANPRATICCFGLYAAMNEQALRAAGADFVLAGEFEEGLVQVARLVDAQRGGTPEPGPPPAAVSTARQQFLVPHRAGLPPLASYAHLVTAAGERLVGATEATRGCKHLCRHCPIVPVYKGRFRVIQRDVVLADIRQQVQAGATHMTFGDPDFFNGPAHSMAIVRELHEEFPSLSYDVTIKIEHLLSHARLIPELKETGCLFVTSAVEAFDEQTLEALEKHHTKQDVIQVVQHFRQVGLHLSPTFVPFTPWTTPQNYLDLLETISDLGLVDAVAPVQYSIRLLIPAGSRLLELPFVQACIGEFDPASLAFPWTHPDPAVDELHSRVLAVVDQAVDAGADRRSVFASLWSVATAAAGCQACHAMPPLGADTTMVPHVTEPWYCCAEPTERQLAPLLPAWEGAAPGDPPVAAPVAPRDSLSDVERMRRAAFLRILEGHAATADYLAERLNLTVAEATEAIRALVEARRGTTDPTGSVVGAAGLSLVETAHSLKIRDGAALWCWCAWDTVGISAALRLTADISTRCGACGCPVPVSAVKGQIAGSASVYGYVPMPSGSPLSCFCPYALLFCSAGHLSSWQAALPSSAAAGGRVLPLAEYAAEASLAWEWAAESQRKG